MVGMRHSFGFTFFVCSPVPSSHRFAISLFDNVPQMTLPACRVLFIEKQHKYSWGIGVVCCLNAAFGINRQKANGLARNNEQEQIDFFHVESRTAQSVVRTRVRVQTTIIIIRLLFSLLMCTSIFSCECSSMFTMATYDANMWTVYNVAMEIAAPAQSSRHCKYKQK